MLKKLQFVTFVLFFSGGVASAAGAAEDREITEPGFETPKITREEVSFQNRDVDLTGSLLIAEDGATDPRPAVLFVAGSGQGPRDQFAAIAEWYAAEGFIALIFDKRGSGASGGNWTTSSLKDLAGDVVAGLEFLERESRVDTNRIGLYGVSQAGWVMPVAARLSKVPDWMIVITGGGVSPRAAESFAYRQAMIHGGIGEAQIAEAMALLAKYFDFLASGNGREALVAAIAAAKAEPWSQFMPLGRVLPSLANQPNWSWVAAYDPVPDIARLSVPALVLLGDRDAQGSAVESAAGWRKGIEASRVAGAKVKIFEEAGHGLVIGSHEEAMHGTPEYVAGYFEVQREWLRERGIIRDEGAS